MRETSTSSSTFAKYDGLTVTARWRRVGIIFFRSPGCPEKSNLRFVTHHCSKTKRSIWRCDRWVAGISSVGAPACWSDLSLVELHLTENGRKQLRGPGHVPSLTYRQQLRTSCTHLLTYLSVGEDSQGGARRRIKTGPGDSGSSRCESEVPERCSGVRSEGYVGRPASTLLALQETRMECRPICMTCASDSGRFVGLKRL